MFITFEGGEGSGKTTLIKKVQKYFKNKYDVVVTREPGGSKISEQIRDIILDKQHTNMTYRTEALLYAASRNQHLFDTILPALHENKIVICDRYIDSSLAYQGYARELGIDYILQINDEAVKYLPDITFFIDIPAEVGLSRIQHRHKIDRLDLEKEAFHQKVRQGYLLVAQKYPDRIHVLDGNLTLNQLEDKIIKVIESYEK